jgi:hypothetical protein
MFLTKAHICINCEWLGEDCMGCAKCGSREVMPLAQWFVPTIDRLAGLQDIADRHIALGEARFESFESIRRAFPL